MLKGGGGAPSLRGRGATLGLGACTHRAHIQSTHTEHTHRAYTGHTRTLTHWENTGHTLDTHWAHAGKHTRSHRAHTRHMHMYTQGTHRQVGSTWAYMNAGHVVGVCHCLGLHRRLHARPALHGGAPGDGSVDPNAHDVKVMLRRWALVAGREEGGAAWGVEWARGGAARHRAIVRVGEGGDSCHHCQQEHLRTYQAQRPQSHHPRWRGERWPPQTPAVQYSIRGIAVNYSCSQSRVAGSGGCALVPAWEPMLGRDMWARVCAQMDG